MWSSGIAHQFIAFAVAMVASWSIQSLLLKIAYEKQMVDKPNHRKLNLRPVPVLGGVGVFFGLMFSLGIAGYYIAGIAFHHELIIALLMMLMIGVADDAVGLSAWTRIFVESIAIVMLVLLCGEYPISMFGVWGQYYIPPMIAVVIMLFVGIGVINAVNMIDGIDGLCAGYIAMCALIYGLGFMIIGEREFAVLAFATMGAIVPFLWCNLFGGRRKMFLGDGGSLVLGLMLVMFVVRFVNSAGAAMQGYVVSFSVAMLAIPVFDTLRVMLRRIGRGVSPFTADKSHLHHKFIELRCSHLTTSVAILFLQLFVVCVWMACYCVDAGSELTLYIVILVGAALTWGLYPILELVKRQRRVRRFVFGGSRLNVASERLQNNRN
ncbi:MAG: undecaprenyl/decaprenyl-phosphate alpha-N-acetylglucosaminyl 1-phosphate transferase [Alistipes sp.]|nr:undecaprenyl/decaprenyl-phosphate alpha-N-acetylglucosaminyl 1-phosphate transferase [Alistipes sp.]